MFLCLAFLVSLAVSSGSALAPLYGPGEYEIIPNEYIVKSSVPLSSLSLHGSQKLQEFHIGSWEVVLVSATDEQVHQLRLDENVEYVQANGYAIHAAVLEDSLQIDPVDYNLQEDAMHGILGALKGETMECQADSTTDFVWGLTRTSSRSLPNYNSGTFRYSASGNGDTVDIYVVDSGVYLEHNDFEGRASHGFTAGDVSHEGPDDLNGHGTHVAGTAAGRQFGVAKGAAVISVKVLGEDNRGTIRDFIEGLDWAVAHHLEKRQQGSNRKSVVNMSLGAFNNNPGFDQSVESAVAQGVPVAVAAMNDNRDACLGSPSKVRTAFTVGSTSISDAISSFSNYGDCVDILGPGQSVRSAFIGSPSATAVYSGTSMATPHVAGVVAQWLSEGDDLIPPAELMAKLIETSTKDVISISPPKGDTPNRLLYSTCDE